jgi:hypothetical protein
MTIERMLEGLNRLVGSWMTEATHRMFPGLVVRGTIEVEWLEGKRFLMHRLRVDHPDFPDSISIIGDMESDRASALEKSANKDANLGMHYFDSRGVFRAFEASIDDEAFRIWRNAPGFSQRFTGKFSADGDTIAGMWELCEDDVNWKDDLAITYRRRQ